MSKLSFLSFHGSNVKKPMTPKSASQVQNPTSTGRSTSYHPTMEEIKKIFNKFDMNGDGKISLEEYKKAVLVLGSPTAMLKAEQEFGAVDADGDGFIDIEEFSAMYSTDGGVKKSEIQEAFKVFDTDGNGKIRAEELMGVLKRMGDKCNLEGCKKMIRGVDRDGDGLIDLHEFMDIMKLS